MKRKVIIMGAARRDYNIINMFYRDNPYEVIVVITTKIIADIEGRKYPAELAGKLYPEGIPIVSESELVDLIKEHNIDLVVFAYSDVNYEYLMHKASIVNAAGADFVLLSATETMIKTTKPLITVCAVRTGCGKSQTSRAVVRFLKEKGLKVASIRHPMPYGDLVKQKVQRFAKIEDLKKHECTIEEMEEYEPHIEIGSIIYAGVDYGAILAEAEKEADVIVWDGGNNDTSFYKSDNMLNIVVADPHRPGHELYYYPGETNLRLADVVIINKIDSANPEDVLEVRDNIRSVNRNAVIIDGASPVFVDDAKAIEGARVLVVEDGPTLTHGEMKYGAGVVAAERCGAAEFVDPRPWAVGTIEETFEKYPEIGTLLPAMGYGEQQIKDLEETINAVDCEVVVIGTPIDLRRIIKINKPAVRVSYELQEIGQPTLTEVLENFVK